MNKILKFPPGFLWGSSTSSYQVEGGIENCDWSKDFPAGKACDHYNRYEEDFDLLKKLNQNTYRFSIEWSRVEPEEGKFDEKEIKHYRQVTSALKKLDIEPFVGLWHWTNPLWIKNKGGWESKKIAYYFSRYAKKIVSSLKNNVKFWITINEPEIYTSSSYVSGIWPPYKKSIFSFISVINNLIKTHKEAYKTIKKIQPDAQVGIATNNTYYEALDDPISHLVKNIVERLDHFYILNKIKNYQEFIGLNYYFHNRIKGFKFNQNENKIVSDLGWEVYPEGIYHVLKNLRKYKKPIYITENGLADAKDKLRKDFIRDHLFWIHKAMEEGIDVKGYFHWSLMDNLEWHKGFEPEFGLIGIDYKTLERKPRPSAFYYAEICKNNSLTI
ncbi:MAG: glycoside hydrolase family 1 protein [Candidatus Nealsonbacteria bacterium CG10_big_fil_rev_8_21_14_0_10_36_23]|uniref:Glycoside hydrolase family 1 protein n=1 Tax=Candidatus Nealsonbacteria bacterium CG10_big_fil_rev_8_21_14_0_10_36_23 TaxID=1974709 RepID=A0A2H0TLQ7_9BACT|nr:MAG: glycoside hydrolase family 1 protein [Candidatus Nealsonbacteria bacterium CG10_big_fil_rev_8_21_14_0_10_36_23]